MRVNDRSIRRLGEFERLSVRSFLCILNMFVEAWMSLRQVMELTQCRDMHIQFINDPLTDFISHGQNLGQCLSSCAKL